MNEPEFSWSAFDKNKCDYYYHNGQQMRFYRQLPESVSGDFERDAWWRRALQYLIDHLPRLSASFPTATTCASTAGAESKASEKAK